MSDNRKRAFNALLTLLDDDTETVWEKNEAKRVKEEKELTQNGPIRKNKRLSEIEKKELQESSDEEENDEIESENDDDEEEESADFPEVEKDIEENSKTEIEGDEGEVDEEEEEEVIEIDVADETHEEDPFRTHFSEPKEFSEPEKWENRTVTTLSLLGTKSILRIPNKESQLGLETEDMRPETQAQAMSCIKHRLKASFYKENGTKFSDLQLQYASPLFNYQDVFITNRTMQNCTELANLSILHILNHIFKTRDKVLRNSSEKNETKQDLDKYRDQGFTRPKVLAILPTRNSAFEFVSKLYKVSGLKQMEQQKRFSEHFFSKGADFETKPDDFKDLFKGNTDELFCLGLKFTRQAIKLYTNFYSSDIIVCSPLGLRMVIDKKGADFLSSIEISYMDRLDALAMQSWANVKQIVEKMNIIPTSMRDCDFSRVREWYLDNKAKYLRQSIMVSPYLTPEMLALYNRSCLNVGGKFRGKMVYEGAVQQLRVRIRQMFHRVNVIDVKEDYKLRLKFLVGSLLPSLLRGAMPDGILVVAPSYADYIVLRNYFEKNDYSFVSMSEYSPASHLGRGRTFFANKKAKIMLYSGRLHHYRRYGIKGTQSVVFYGLPDNPDFYSEIVLFLAKTVIADGVDPDLLKAHTIFTKWDALKLERVVGTKNVGRLLSGKDDVTEIY